MSDNRVTFRVRCPHCERSFDVRYGLQDADREGERATVIVDCLHCGKSSTIPIPGERVGKEATFRGVVEQNCDRPAS